MENIQRMSGVMQEHLAEARNLKAAHERSLSEFQYGQFVECMMEASFCAERLTEKLRRLLVGTLFSRSQRADYQKELVKIHGISVKYEREKQILKVELPCLLPHRKSSYTDYIYKPLQLALQDWCFKQDQTGMEIPVFERAAVCFVHQYNRELPPTKIRDHDNIEEKQVVDALGMFFLVSDSGLYLDTYHTSRLGDRDRTLLFLMGQTVFPQWICHYDKSKDVSKKEPVRSAEKSTG